MTPARRRSGFSLLAGLIAIVACGPFAPAARAQSPAPAPATMQAPLPPATWPRTYQKNGSTLLLYAPQVDKWTDHSKIEFRMALALTVAGSAQTHYGVASVRADTMIDDATRSVLIMNMDPAFRFPGVDGAQAAQLKALADDCLPKLSFFDASLDEITAYTHAKVEAPRVQLNLNPPPMYFSDVPAILVVYMGQPQFKPVTGAKLMFAVNTNWVVLMDEASSQYFLLYGDSWLTAPDPMNGPWTPAATLPAEFSRLPDSGNWKDVRSHIPGTPLTAVPRVITSPEPAELIATNGTPDYTPLPGTRLMYVSNPPMPLFLDLVDSNYYFMVSGRWFRAPDVNGPWTAASTDLPPEFAKIPSQSPVGFVLASVPGTQESRDAVALATIPHKATLTISGATVAVAYDGPPKFAPIPTTTMTYAVNTAYQVVCVSGQYYCCYQGAWFVAPASTGPWALCTSVPTVIYTIPPSSPLYNVTYVQVYSSTPTTVVVGYTSGYSGEYVAQNGALMFGAGMPTGAMLASNANWYCCSPCYYSYGCAAHYSYAYGGYYRAGGAYYGPHGGAGWGSAYNPATGTWARAGAAYGPSGSHWGAQAYNPWTNTYAEHTGGSNGYASHGQTYVQQGNNWAEAGHQSTARGSAGWAENSSGQWAEGAHSNFTNSSVAKTSSGDVYASHDGNVYKNTDGQWQKYTGNGNWQDTSYNKPTAQSHAQSPASAASSTAAESNWQNSMKNRQSTTPASSGGDSWKNDWENRSNSSDTNNWSQHDNQRSLDQDSWSRNHGSENAASSWQSRSSEWDHNEGGGWGSRSSGGGLGAAGFGSRFGASRFGGGRFRR